MTEKIITDKINMLDAMLHELNNPLTAISVMSDMLVSDKKPLSTELMDSAIKALGQSSKEALVVAGRISDYSQSDLSNLEIKPERIEIISSLRRILPNKSGAADLIKGMKIQFHSDLNECHIDFTEILFQLLVTNLVANAIRHSGGSKLIVKVQKQFPISKRVKIVFEDDGVGIPRREVNSIFAPFKRGSNAKDGDGGKGIGLALVKQIVGAHGGDLSLADGPKGKGACFVVSLALPLSDANLNFK